MYKLFLNTQSLLITILKTTLSYKKLGAIIKCKGFVFTLKCLHDLLYLNDIRDNNELKM